MGLGCKKERDYVKHKVMGQDNISSHFKLIMMAYPKKFDDSGAKKGSFNESTQGSLWKSETY